MMRRRRTTTAPLADQAVVSVEQCVALIAALLMLTWIFSMLWAFESALSLAPHSSSYRSIDALRGFVVPEKAFHASTNPESEHEINELRKGGIPVTIKDDEWLVKKGGRHVPERPGLNGELTSEVHKFIELGLYPPTADAWAKYRRAHLEQGEQARSIVQNVQFGSTTPHDDDAKKNCQRVFIDWPHSTFKFSQHNYASLESMIKAYETETSCIKLIATVVAPAKMTKEFRYSNANSYTQFERYTKLGVQVETRLLDSSAQLYSSQKNVHNPGQTFWKHNRKSQCPKYVDFTQYYADDSRDVIPRAGISFFFRIHSLWREGGIFNDLSIFTLRKIPETRSGFAIAGINCGPNMSTVQYHPNAPPPMLLSFPRPQSTILACILRAFDACEKDLDCADKIAMQAARQFRNCYARLGQRNELGGSIEWFGCRPRGAHLTLFSNTTDDKIGLLAPLETRFAVWLGPDATNGEWRIPDIDSILYHLYAQNLPNLGPSDTNCRSWLLEAPKLRFPDCRPFKAPLAGRGSKAIIPAERRAAAFSCAPNIIIPAAQKGASSYLFSLLYTHPQTLRPLRGSQYKEPGAYVNAVYFRQLFGRRLSRFAFHRFSEALVSIDATVTYATESRLPALRAAYDNPTAKIIFALREPVDRSFSDYRFCYRPYYYKANVGWDELITRVLPLYETCYTDRIFSTKQNSSTADLVQEAFYGTLCNDLLLRRADPNGLVRKSMYFPQVHLFATIYGLSNIIIVTSEQLRENALNVARHLTHFLGLCPFDFKELPPVHVTPVYPNPEHYWSSAVYEQYRAWIQPFNNMLFDFLHTDANTLGWGTTLKRPNNFRDELSESLLRKRNKASRRERQRKRRASIALDNRRRTKPH